MILRNALRDTMRDPGFQADAQRQELNISYIDGEQLLATISSAYRTPGAIIQRTKDALGRVARQ
jgi:tripartite-type tricarboxylate transporter receptor subunit TctC